ncbi:MAG TPA: NlpC/P60 family protein [Acidimicrobiales bacterium]|nr:NlpC/P60 family protein [Acidimicrobiales bacterium]
MGSIRIGTGGALFAATAICALSITSPAWADPTPSQPGQGAATLQSAQEQASQIEAQVQADSDRLDVLDQQYEVAQQQVQSLDQSLLVTGAKVVATEATIGEAQAVLRDQALSIYTKGSAVFPLTRLFSPGNEHSSLVQTYEQVASADVSATIDRLHAAQQVLAQQQSQIQASEAKARTASGQLAQAQSQAQSVLASQQSALSQVKGQIATLLAQQEAAQQAADAAAFAARLAGSGAGLDADAPVSPGAAGAVQAAESQLGVPYVWGGEQPGVGFDCSGLTQWSWGRAGVSIPRTAQEQYDAIPHVPLSALQPGDLLFWDDGTSSVQHVAMYVGGGDVIQAPQTGEDVSYSPIWTDGLVGAGRP